MTNQNTSMIEKPCCNLIASFGEKISWKWDSRFETALTQFSIKKKDWAHDIIKTQMENIWDSGNKNEAPEAIKDIIEYFGGLEPAQKLYTLRLDTDTILLCAWWPWGNGQTLSIRLGFYANAVSDDENEVLTSKFRSWFNL